ncbi:unnamed protein product [Blepharisma stoltei]|uniref:Uncharacterized protein n=1 Tax=Blepharisma stoltei TaxID=1481888 RepID=A0AAU9K5W5_9CILI|nr:unnamed protein product [Blepharisma stoltei]
MISKPLYFFLLICFISASSDFQNKFFSPNSAENVCKDPSSLECKLSFLSSLTTFLTKSNFFTIPKDQQGKPLTGYYSVFMAGVITGLQKNPSTPSTCVQSISSTTTAYNTFIGSFSILPTEIFDSLDNFSDFVNKFTASYDSCAIQTLTNTILSLATEKGFAQLLVHYGVNFTAVNAALEDYFANLESGNVTKQGQDVGKLITYLLAWSI